MVTPDLIRQNALILEIYQALESKMQSFIWPWRDRFAHLGARVILIIFFSWWSFKLVFSWQDPVVEDKTRETPCGGAENMVNNDENCAPEASDAPVAIESSPDPEKPAPSRYRPENIASRDEVAVADAVAMDERAGGQLYLHVDPYDPLSWPNQPAGNSGLESIAPIDPYDSTTWPERDTPDLNILPVEPIDLFDAATWPVNGMVGNEVLDAVPRSTIDIYDASTWLQDNTAADTTEFANPIDPYDPETWPDEP
jgi:hypothetical protein